MSIFTDITRQVFKHNKVELSSPAFAAHWNEEYSIVKCQDVHANVKDLLGDSFNPEVNNDIDPKLLKRQEKAEVARIKKHGVWGCGLMRKGERPDYDTFIWGFVGDDFIGSGYDTELIELLNQLGTKVEI